MNSDVQGYCQKAMEDKIACEILNAAVNKKMHAVICFHAQQMAEKIAKALWKEVHPECDILRTHDVAFVLLKSNDIYPVSDKMLEWAKVLTTYEAVARYDVGEKLGENEAKTAMYYANKIYDWAMARICEHECGNSEELGEFVK